MRRRRRRWRNRIGIAVRRFAAFASSRSDGPPVAGAFKPRIIRKSGAVAERRLPRTCRPMIESRRRSATHAVRGPNRGLKAPATGRASLRDARRSTSARSASSRNCAACGRASSWKSFACWRRAARSRKVPDYELHRLTTRTPAFFDETVRRQVESLEKELKLMESEADGLAKEIEELTGETAVGWEQVAI